LKAPLCGVFALLVASIGLFNRRARCAAAIARARTPCRRLGRLAGTASPSLRSHAPSRVSPLERFGTRVLVWRRLRPVWAAIRP